MKDMQLQKPVKHQLQIPFSPPHWYTGVDHNSYWVGNTWVEEKSDF